MIPISLRLQGIGPHADTMIGFGALQSPIALCAAYGTGKTFLLEGVYAALYGDFAWYAGSIYDSLTQGGTGDAEISLAFTHAGAEYTITRTLRDTGKTKTHRVLLFRGKVQIAGPKVADADRAVRALIGDPETALATWFLSQNRANDLCGQPGDKDLVARRRAVFNSLVGADRLDALADRCGKEANRLEAVATDLEAQLAGEPDPAAQIATETAALAETRHALKGAQTRLNEAEIALEDARKRLRDAEGGDDVLQAQIAEHERAVKAAQDAQARVTALTAECDALEKRATGLVAAREEAERLKARLGERSGLQDALRAREAWEKWDRRRGELAVAAEHAQARVRTLESVPGADDATRALAAELSALRERYAAGDAENRQRRARNAARQARRDDYRDEGARIDAQIAAIDKRLATKPQTPGGAVCETCPLLKDFRELPVEREALKDRQVALVLATRAIEPDEPETDLGPLRDRGVEARKAAEAVEAAEATRANLDAARAVRTDAENGALAHAETRPEEMPDPRSALAECQAEIDRLAGAPERVKACEQAAADLKTKLAQEDAADTELAEHLAAGDVSKPRADSARAALADRERQRAALRSAVQQLEAGRGAAQQETERLQGETIRAETRIAELEHRAEEQAAKRSRARSLRDDLDGYRDLRQVFGPRGVRQILIDDAAPALEAIADDLFERATGGRQRLRIATQKILQDGSTAEDFSIMVRDERGERDATRYSGGQLTLIQILFRIAVALWVGQLRGQRPECLFLDEAFDRLGAEGTDDLLRVLEYLEDRISLIVVVTHDPLIAERLRSRVTLTRSYSGVALEVHGAREAAA